MSQLRAYHIRQLADLIADPGTTQIQREAFGLAIIAMRRYSADVRECGKLKRIIRDGLDADLVRDLCGDDGVPTSVYKYFDKNEILIYVGITGVGIQRQRQHNESKEWWKFVHRQQVEHFKSRALAHEREIVLIERFKPPFNKQHNADYAAVRRFYLDMIEGRAPVLRSDPNDKVLAFAENLM